MEVVPFQTESGKGVPSAHVSSGRRQAGDLPVNLEQAIVVEILEARVVLFELTLHRSIKQLDIGIGKSSQRSRDGHQVMPGCCPGWKDAGDIGTGRGGGRLW